MTNPSRPITVNNQVIFTDWNDVILSDTSYTFKAQLKNPNSSWTIDIYDANGSPVNSATGQASNGQVSWTWNLMDSQNHLRNNSDSDPYFTSRITFHAYPSGVLTTELEPPSSSRFPGVGQWVIAYQDRCYLDDGANGADPYYQAAMTTLGGGPVLHNDPVVNYPIRFGTAVYTQAQRDTSWNSLLWYMCQPSTRNFYYWGHGNATSIGGDAHQLDGNGNAVRGTLFRNSKAKLDSKTVRDSITANKVSGARPYRFVFLDCCNSANGDWPSAFGIGTATYTDTSWYLGPFNTSHIRPSAFVGWASAIGGSGWGTGPAFFNFRSYWMGYWSMGSPGSLRDALTDANMASGWVGPNQLNSSLRIFGYENMGMEDYNHKGDWQYP